MAENKTQPTDASVDDHLAARASPQQHADCVELMAMFTRITGEPPRVWGPSIVGHGRYRYTYDSGRSGEMPLAAFAIRGRELVVYVDVDPERQASLLPALGKHRRSRACLYFKQLADLDRSVLENLVVDSIHRVQRHAG